MDALFSLVGSFYCAKSPLAPLCQPMGDNGGLGGICLLTLMLPLQLSCIFSQN